MYKSEKAALLRTTESRKVKITPIIAFNHNINSKSFIPFGVYLVGSCVLKTAPPPHIFFRDQLLQTQNENMILENTLRNVLIERRKVAMKRISS